LAVVEAGHLAQRADQDKDPRHLTALTASSNLPIQHWQAS